MSIQGFFGLKVVPGKTYTQIAENSFRITMASLAEGGKNNARASLCLKVDDNDFVLCSLTPGKLDQQLLDLIIVKGEQVTFSVQGQQTIHLTGNYLFEGEDIDEDEDDEESEEMDSDEAELMLEDDDEDESDDEDLLANVPEGIDRAKVIAYLNGEIDSDDMGSDSEEELDESRIEEIEEEEEEEEPKPLTKKEKKAAAAAEREKAAAAEAAAAAAAAAAAKPLTKKEKKAAAAAEREQATKQEKKRAADAEQEEPTKKQKTEEKKPKQQEKKQVTKMANGLIIEDVKVGEGASVRSGARIGMRYIGKLTNGKVFDKNVSGKPFNFRLGAGEVIKGWDQGIVGMKLGGERKLTIPAPLAYGKRGAPPQIPGNATLVFEIKLVNMK